MRIRKIVAILFCLCLCLFNIGAAVDEPIFEDSTPTEVIIEEEPIFEEEEILDIPNDDWGEITIPFER